jgi:hypothetical protein
MGGVRQVSAVVEIQWATGGYAGDRTEVSGSVAVDVDAPRVRTIHYSIKKDTRA